MFANLTGWHLLVVLAVVLLIFGAAKLPALARALGQSARILRSEAKDLHDGQSPKPDQSDT
ncbi:twin-arginine translocase TatA/TatE family subunit [Leifsonia sp. NPDC056665]|uniref:twin-arginine translocase TatA/TatE family subunit n=1 Tax=Leifsonia sp. NPDC056665 TaxID=3345901 RepID=UPI0036A95651